MILLNPVKLLLVMESSTPHICCRIYFECQAPLFLLLVFHFYLLTQFVYFYVVFISWVDKFNIFSHLGI